MADAPEPQHAAKKQKRLCRYREEWVGKYPWIAKALLCVHIRSELRCKDALVAHKDSLRIFLFAFVAQVAHDVQFNFADAFKGAVCF